MVTPLSALKPSDMIPSTLEDIERTVSQHCPTSGTRYNARFVLHWDPIRYVKEELSYNDSNSRSQRSLLDSCLAFTGTAQAAYAATVDDYLKWKWPQRSDRTIQLVVDAMQTIKMDRLSKQSVSAADGDADHSQFRISIEDTQENLTGLAGQLAWLAAVCRASEHHQASYSQISFKFSPEEDNSFEIIPLPLQRVEESNVDSATCWLPIFKRSVIAHGFPVPERQGEKGIELPFSLMTDQSGVLYPIKYKGRVFLRGFSCMIFPTSASKKFQAVQWHLNYSGDSNRRLPHSTLPSCSEASRDGNSHWLKSTDIKGLSKAPRTFLGYCKHVEVDLCTKQGSINRIQISGACTEKHRPGSLWKPITAGFPGTRILSLAVGAKITRRRGLTEEAKERRLPPRLNEAMGTATEAMAITRTLEELKLPKQFGESDERSLVR